MSPGFQPDKVVLPLAWRADPSPSYRGPTLRALPDPGIDPLSNPAPARPPVVRNAFVGRDALLRETVRRLSVPDARVVTLVGRSGVGKTRLALEVARRLGGAYPGGAVLLDFTAADGGSIASLVSTSLGIRVSPGQPTWDAVSRKLRFEPALLIADDVDLVDGALDVLLQLIVDAPDVRILATAQRATGHEEEHVVRLRPLPVPASGVDVETIRSTPAVALYLARVNASDPERPVPDDDLDAIAELCRRLDGLPLAIELGAGRARLLSPAGQLRELEKADPLAVRATRGERRPARHQDLRSAIETTWAMTELAERCVLRRMAVFAGPPTLDHLEAVVADEDLSATAIIDALAALVDLGLVEAEMPTGGDTRYRLLPTIRAFALEQLAASGEGDLLGHRHADLWLEVARRSRQLAGTAQAAVLAREAGDLAVALAFLEVNGRPADALELASDLVLLWIRVGVSDTARTTHARLLSAAEAPDTVIPDAVCARGLVAAAILAIQGSTVGHMQGQVADWLRRAVALARAAGDEGTLLFALEWMAVGIVVTGDGPVAFAANAEGLELAKASGSSAVLTRFEYRQSMFTALAGDIPSAVAFGGTALRRARAHGDPESTVRTGMHLYWFPRDVPGMPADLPSLEELLGLARGAGCLFEEGVLYPQLAFERLLAGDVAGAARWCEAGLRFATRYGAWQGITLTLVALMLVAGATGDDRAVARIYGRVAPELDVVDRSMAVPGAREHFAMVLDGARERLGEEAFGTEAASTAHLDRDATIEWAIGQARRLAGVPDVAPDAVVAEQSPADAASSAPEVPSVDEGASRPNLTGRERDVLREIASGATNREIGATLGLSEKTVMHHSVSIYAKLGVRGRSEAAAWAARSGFLDTASKP